MEKIKSKGKLKIILTNSVRKLGKRGDVVEVKHGYFRNFLSNGLAIKYNDEQLNHIKGTLKSAFDSKHEEIAKEQSIKLANQYLYFGRQASGTDILFASVTTKDVVNEIKSKYNIEINYKKVFFNDSIKKIGIYKFSIDLSENISVDMFLSVGRSVEDSIKMAKENKEAK